MAAKWKKWEKKIDDILSAISTATLYAVYIIVTDTIMLCCITGLYLRSNEKNTMF